jgi:uncharacterized protein (DUF433 family)
MAKPKIEAKLVVQDIRSGMEDADLMEKYRLSAKGLQSLFTKLLEFDLIQQEELDERMLEFEKTVTIAKDVVRKSLEHSHRIQEPIPESQPKTRIDGPRAIMDIQAGLDDAQLMAKYGLSAKGLQSMFRKLVARGLIAESMLDERMAAVDATVDLNEAIDTLNVGLPTYLQPVEIPEPPLSETELEVIDKTLQREDLPAPSDADEGAVTFDGATGETPYYDRPALVLFLLCSLFPLGMYALYRNSTFSKTMKVVVAAGWVTAVAAVIVLAFNPAPSRGAEDIVLALNASHREYCQAELTGWSGKTLKIDWSIRSKRLQKEEILSEIDRAKTRLLRGGVRYLQVPNDVGTYDLVDWKTGRKKSIDQKAFPYIR